MQSAGCLDSEYNELDIGISCDELSIVGCMLLSSTMDGRGTRLISWVSMLGVVRGHGHIDQCSAGLAMGVREEDNISTARSNLRILDKTRYAIQVLVYEWLSDGDRVVTLDLCRV